MAVCLLHHSLPRRSRAREAEADKYTPSPTTTTQEAAERKWTLIGCNSQVLLTLLDNTYVTLGCSFAKTSNPVMWHSTWILLYTVSASLVAVKTHLKVTIGQSKIHFLNCREVNKMYKILVLYGLCLIC